MQCQHSFYEIKSTFGYLNMEVRTVYTIASGVYNEISQFKHIKPNVIKNFFLLKISTVHGTIHLHQERIKSDQYGSGWMEGCLDGMDRWMDTCFVSWGTVLECISKAQ